MPYLSTTEVASILRLHYTTVSGWCRNGIIKAVKIGRNYKIHASELDRLTGMNWRWTPLGRSWDRCNPDGLLNKTHPPRYLKNEHSTSNYSRTDRGDSVRRIHVCGVRHSLPDLVALRPLRDLLQRDWRNQVFQRGTRFLQRNLSRLPEEIKRGRTLLRPPHNENTNGKQLNRIRNNN